MSGPKLWPGAEDAMALAVDTARRGGALGEQPYGAVVVDPDGRLIARAHDEVAGRRDPTAHAELLAVRRAVEARGPDLSGCTLACTVEPCAMCFQAAWWANVGRLVFGVSMRDLLDVVPGAFEEVVIDSATLNELAHRRLEIAGDVLRDECLGLWQDARSGL